MREIVTDRLILITSARLATQHELGELLQSHYLFDESFHMASQKYLIRIFRQSASFWTTTSYGPC